MTDCVLRMCFWTRQERVRSIDSQPSSPDSAGELQVITRYTLRDNYYQSGWGEKYRVGTSLKWTPAEPKKEKLPPVEQLRAMLPVKTPAVFKRKKQDLVQAKLRADILHNRLAKIHAAMQQRWTRRSDSIPADFVGRSKAVESLPPPSSPHSAGPAA